MLILPRQKNPDVLEPFEPQDKIFRVQKESEEWGDKLDVATVEISMTGLQEKVCRA